MDGNIILVVGIAVLIIIFLMVFFTFVPVGLWITALFTGVRVKTSTKN